MAHRTHLPFDADLVRAWRLGTGHRGAVLLHGFASTPPELRRLGEYLAAHGFTCVAPTLAGHGGIPEDLSPTRWQDWAASASAAVDELAAECDDVVIAGQSMGGTLALHTAANDPRISAVAALAAPIWLSGVAVRVIPVLKYLVKWHYPGTDVDLFDRAAVAELHSYGRRPTRSIHELLRLLSVTRNELATIRQPVLLIHGARDATVDPRNAADIERRLVCSAAVERVMLARSGHGVSVDVDREEVNRLVAAWFDRHGPSSPEPRPPQLQQPDDPS